MNTESERQRQREKRGGGGGGGLTRQPKNKKTKFVTVDYKPLCIFPYTFLCTNI